MCELCGATENLENYNTGDGSDQQSLMLCETCRTQINNPDTLDANHWRCLNDTMWSEKP